MRYADSESDLLEPLIAEERASAQTILRDLHELRREIAEQYPTTRDLDVVALVGEGQQDEVSPAGTSSGPAKDEQPELSRSGDTRGKEPRPMRYTSIEELRRTLPPEEREHRLAVLALLRKERDEMAAAHGVEFFPDSTPLIRAMRDGTLEEDQETTPQTMHGAREP